MSITEITIFKVDLKNKIEGIDHQIEDACQKFAIKYMDCERISYRGHDRISEEELNSTNRHDKRAAKKKTTELGKIK